MITQHTPSEVEDDDTLKASFDDWAMLFYFTDIRNHAFFFQERIAKMLELEETPVSVFINTGQTNVFQTQRVETDEWSTNYLSGHVDPELAIQFDRTKAQGTPFPFSDQVDWSRQLSQEFRKLQVVTEAKKTLVPINCIRTFRDIWQRAWDYYTPVI